MKATGRHGQRGTKTRTSYKFPAADVQLGFTKADEVISNARERRV